MRVRGSLRVVRVMVLCLMGILPVMPLCGVGEADEDFEVNIMLQSQEPIMEGTTVRLKSEVGGIPGGASLTYTWSGEGVAFDIMDEGKSVTFTAPDVGPDVEPQGQDITIRLTVTASVGDETDSAQDEITLAVHWVNAQPVAEAGGTQTVFEGERVTLDGSGSFDPDGQALTFLWEQTGGAAVSLQGADTVRASFVTPSVGPSGATLTFKLTVRDGEQGSFHSDTCVVRVNSANGPPVADAGGDRSVGEQEQVTLDGGGSRDPDGDPLTWAWTQEEGVSVQLSDPTVENPVFESPNVDENGATLVFSLVVTDPEGLSDQDRCLITVLGGNEIPSVEAGKTQEVVEGERVVLDGSGCRDPEGGELKYLWVQTDGVGVELESPASRQATFTAPEVGPDGAFLAFDLFVEDPGGLKARDHCFVDVLDGDGQGGTLGSGGGGGGCETGSSIGFVSGLMLLVVVLMIPVCFSRKR